MPDAYHYARLRVTAHATEDEARVAAALRHVCGLDEEAFAAAVKRTAMETHHGAPLIWFEVELRRNRDVRDLVSRLSVAAGPSLRESLEERVDEEGTFFVRLDKQQAYEGNLVVATTNDPVQVRIRANVHPATRETAVAAYMAALEPSANA